MHAPVYIYGAIPIPSVAHIPRSKGKMRDLDKLLTIMLPWIVLILTLVTGCYVSLNVSRTAVRFLWHLHKGQHIKVPMRYAPHTAQVPADAEVLQEHVEWILGQGTRVAGSHSVGHNATREFLVSSIRELDPAWHVQLDSFKQFTVLGDKWFYNVIATLQLGKAPTTEKPKLPRTRQHVPPNTLVLAAHYDSKYMQKHEFLGATDSAAACVLLIHLATEITKQYKKGRYSNGEAQNLMSVFFDGEEAFQDWTLIDSTYGSRHLASEWERSDTIQNVKLFVLMDLIGTAGAPIYSYFNRTAHHFAHMRTVQDRLRDSDKLLTIRPHTNATYLLQTELKDNMVADDHTPFVKLDVPVVHLVPTPFPKVWHKATDDATAVDYRTLYDLFQILGTWCDEYFRKQQ